MPQPIDPSSELGRVAAAERVQQMMDRAVQHAQLRQVDDAADDTIRQQEQAKDAEQKRDEVDDEQRRRQPYIRIRRKKKDGEHGHEHEHDGYNARRRPEDTDDPDEHTLDVVL